MLWCGDSLLPPTDVTVLADASPKQGHRREDAQRLLDDALQVAQILQVLGDHVAV